jgi:hypothetical protein
VVVVAAVAVAGVETVVAAGAWEEAWKGGGRGACLAWGDPWAAALEGAWTQRAAPVHNIQT